MESAWITGYKCVYEVIVQIPIIIVSLFLMVERD